MSAPRSLSDLQSRLKVPLWAALGLSVAPVLLLGLLLLRDVFAMRRESGSIAQLTSLDREAAAFAAALRTSQVLIRDYARVPGPALRERLRGVAAEVSARGAALGHQGEADSARTASWERLLARRARFLDSMVAMPPDAVPAWFTARPSGRTTDSLLVIAERIIVQAREVADTRQLALAARVQTAQQQALLLVALAGLSALVGTWLVIGAVRGERRLRERLELEEARLERTFDDAPTGMAIVSLEGRFTRVNAALCDMMGYSADELVGSTYAEITNPDDLVGDEVLAAQLASGALARYEYEKRYIAKDGSLVPIMLHGSAVRRADGTLEHFIAQIVDLRAQKAAQSASMNRKAELRSILDNAEDVVFRYDREASVTYVNLAARRVTGLTAEQLIGRPVEQLTVTPADAARWRMAIGRVFATGEPDGWEFDHVAPDGVRRWFSVRLTPVRDLSGAVTGVVEFSRDLTALRSAEMELRRQEARFLALFESSEDVVIQYDAGLRLQYINPEAYRATGLRPDQLMGKHVSELPLGEALAPRWIAAVQQVAATGGHVRLEYAYPDATGRLRHYDAKLSAERDFEGQITSVLVVSRDISDLREAANRLAVREAELRSIVETSEDLIYRYDAEGRIRYLNPAVLRASGRTLESCQGMTVLEALGDSPVAHQISEAIDRVLRARTPETIEYGVVRPTDGVEHFYTCRFVPERTETGAVIGVVALARDITARRRIELERERLLAELTRAQAAVKTLKGLLPTCAWCHRIKDDQGHWEQMETYITRRTDAEFSHGLCPECATRMMTE